MQQRLSRRVSSNDLFDEPDRKRPHPPAPRTDQFLQLSHEINQPQFLHTCPKYPDARCINFVMQRASGYFGAHPIVKPFPLQELTAAYACNPERIDEQVLDGCRQ